MHLFLKTQLHWQIDNPSEFLDPTPVIMSMINNASFVQTPWDGNALGPALVGAQAAWPETAVLPSDPLPRGISIINSKTNLRPTKVTDPVPPSVIAQIIPFKLSSCVVSVFASLLTNSGGTPGQTVDLIQGMYPYNARMIQDNWDSRSFFVIPQSLSKLSRTNRLTHSPFHVTLSGEVAGSFDNVGFAFDSPGLNIVPQSSKRFIQNNKYPWGFQWSFNTVTGVRNPPLIALWPQTSFNDTGSWGLLPEALVADPGLQTKLQVTTVIDLDLEIPDNLVALANNSANETWIISPLDFVSQNSSYGPSGHRYSVSSPNRPQSASLFTSGFIPLSKLAKEAEYSASLLANPQVIRSTFTLSDNFAVTFTGLLDARMTVSKSQQLIGLTNF